nr:immunoglobulin light chain junction region [Macaca mulatta]
CQQHNNYPVTF